MLRDETKIKTGILKVQHLGILLIDIAHYVAVLMIMQWLYRVMNVAGWEFVFWLIILKGKAALKDILMLFIYLELLAMIGIYFKTHRLPVQFLIYIAITALSRHLVVDVQAVADDFHLWLLVTICLCIFMLSLAIVLLTWTANQFGRPEDNVHPNKR